MSLETDADRLAMLQALGEEVYINSCAVACVFESPFYEFELGREVEGTSYSATVRTSDMATANIVRGSELLRNGVTYTVVGVEPDGEGMTILRLSE